MSLYESGYALDVNVLDILAGLSCPNKSLVIPTLEMIEDNVGTTGSPFSITARRRVSSRPRTR